MSNDYIETIPLMREGWLGKQKKQSGNTTLHSNWDWTQEGLYIIIGETTAIDFISFHVYNLNHDHCLFMDCI